MDLQYKLRCGLCPSHPQLLNIHYCSNAACTASCTWLLYSLCMVNRTKKYQEVKLKLTWRNNETHDPRSRDVQQKHLSTIQVNLIFVFYSLSERFSSLTSGTTFLDKLKTPTFSCEMYLLFRAFLATKVAVLGQKRREFQFVRKKGTDQQTRISFTLSTSVNECNDALIILKYWLDNYF